RARGTTVWRGPALRCPTRRREPSGTAYGVPRGSSSSFAPATPAGAPVRGRRARPSRAHRGTTPFARATAVSVSPLPLPAGAVVTAGPGQGSAKPRHGPLVGGCDGPHPSGSTEAGARSAVPPPVLPEAPR